MPNTLSGAFEHLLDLSRRIEPLTFEHPDWTVVPNALRNWAIVDKDDNQVGHIDLLQGDVEVYDA